MAFRSGVHGHFPLGKGKVIFQAKGGIPAKSFLKARDESGKLGLDRIVKDVRGS